MPGVGVGSRPKKAWAEATSPCFPAQTGGASSYDTSGSEQNPTAGALRAAKAIQDQKLQITSLPELIDRETGVREILEILESIVAQAGDLIESRNPELVAAARAALKRYSDEAPRQAE